MSHVPSLEVRKLPRAFESALQSLFAQIDSRKGVILSSGFEYPGRHSRWDIGFVDPAVEIEGYADRFTARALNSQGELILEILEPNLRQCPAVSALERSKSELHGKLLKDKTFFTEENRSRQPSLFSVMRSVQELFKTSDSDLEHFGLYGVFAYDLIHQFETLELKMRRPEDAKLCHLFIPLNVVIVDRQREKAWDCAYTIRRGAESTDSREGGGEGFSLPKPQGSNAIRCDHEPGEFAAKVAKIIEGTKRGDYFEVVLSQKFSTRFEDSPSLLFEKLQRLNPSPYLFLVNLGDEQLVGSSPEIYVRVTNKLVETCPISGTVRRGDDAVEEAELLRALYVSEKEESELTMCTDVGRNDLARVSTPGSVRISGRRQLERYSHLSHTVDHLISELQDGFDALDAFQVHMWPCTVTGSPKPAAMQEIENLENSPREWYAGAVGLFSVTGNLNTGIMLRTAHLKGGEAHVRAGATLLFECSPEAEELETRTKAEALLVALTSANGGASLSSSPSNQKVQIPRNETLMSVVLIQDQPTEGHWLSGLLEAEGVRVNALSTSEVAQSIDKPPALILITEQLSLSTAEYASLLQTLTTKGSKVIFSGRASKQAFASCYGDSFLEHCKLHQRVLKFNSATLKLSQERVFLNTPFFVPKAKLPDSFVVLGESGEDLGAALYLTEPTSKRTFLWFNPGSLLSASRGFGVEVLLHSLAN